ncbi:MAG: cation transporter [Clostridia bacterium]|nr:cation transporter [Clostridia bacterium]
MTKLLLKLFVKDYENRQSVPKVRSAVGKLSGGVGIACNILLCVMKLLIGSLTGSIAITADAMNNLSDATGSIVTLIGFKMAEKPADEEHPYGHARSEYLSALAVAALILIIGFELAKTSVDKIIHPTEVEFTVPAAVVLVISVLLKMWLFLFNRRLGKEIRSNALLATAADSRNDAIATSAVLLCSVVSLFTSLPLDGIVGLAVALFILYSGVSLGKETISPLIGESGDSELHELIVGMIENEEKVLGYHDLLVHDYGPGQRFASCHVEMDSREDAMFCHELIDNLERRCLQEHNVHLVIHYDPVVTDDEELSELRDTVLQLLQTQDARISVHDFRMVRGEGHTNLIFDIVLPSDLMPNKKQIKKKLDEDLNRDAQTQFYTVVTFDMSTFNA